MKILVIEDESKLATSLKKSLETESFAVDIALTGNEGLDKAYSQEYDLIILDLGLPDMDGVHLSQELREEKMKTPILMLTARDTLSDKIQGLNSGADDYLVKPFEFAELVARIRSIIRRTQQREPTIILKIGSLTLDPSSRIAKRGKIELLLSAKEYALLEYLMRNQGNICTKTQIIDHVWDSELDLFSNVVDVYIGYLRNKIDRAFPKEKPLLKTIKGIGYKLG